MGTFARQFQKESKSPYQEMVEQLDVLINYWKNYNKLFCGGCMFTASIIAKQLKKRNIPYKIIGYKYTSCKDNNLMDICNHDDLAHVAIQVEETIIGGEGFFAEYYVKEYYESSSDEMKEIYETNRWNPRYDTSLNNELIKEIDMLFSIFD